ncbi:MAG: hypothetical protein RRY52_07935, partial [Anaerovoracaceae bacterium]
QEGNVSQELKDLLAYIGDPQNMSTEPLIMKIDEEIKRVRVDPESRREFMLFEVKLNEARVEGEKRGIAIGEAKVVINLLETMSVSDVSKVTKIPEEEVLKIQEEKN